MRANQIYYTLVIINLLLGNFIILTLNKFNYAQYIPMVLPYSFSAILFFVLFKKWIKSDTRLISLCFYGFIISIFIPFLGGILLGVIIELNGLFLEPLTSTSNIKQIITSLSIITVILRSLLSGFLSLIFSSIFILFFTVLNIIVFWLYQKKLKTFPAVIK
ncbi:hypothetical protein SAMN02745728_00315 [Desulfovibrio litoralis DSM 11393]|uniref:Uncharacterized protein n=1 Tax=Desulfovibrio litoralis DSM 11393 TaxID=1121455 RepID=A0A1M7RY20_9BACT|nr:hypothetical protein SAMN02745728_00315 [Desulfovibrio litoralis DSM 11393]